MKGKQQPFNWAVLRKLAPDIDIFDGIQELYNRLAQQDPVTYLIPDLDVGSVQEVTVDTKWLPRAMPAAKMGKMLRSVACQLNISTAWVEQWTGYTPRRFTPS